MKRAMAFAAVFFLAFAAGLLTNAQAASPTGFAYGVGYTLEIQVNGSAAYSVGSNASIGPAGTQLIALEYPLTVNLIANNYSAVEASGGGSYYFPPVVETQTITQTITKTITITDEQGRVYTTVVTIPAPSKDARGGGLDPKLVGVGLLAFLFLAFLATRR